MNPNIEDVFKQQNYKFNVYKFNFLNKNVLTYNKQNRKELNL